MRRGRPTGEDAITGYTWSYRGTCTGTPTYTQGHLLGKEGDHTCAVDPAESVLVYACDVQLLV